MHRPQLNVLIERLEGWWFEATQGRFILFKLLVCTFQ